MLERMMNLPSSLIAENQQLIEELKLAQELAQAESTRDTVLQMQQSLFRIVAIQQLLQLRVRWNPEQAQRQQQRLLRQRARLQWQKAMFERLRDDYRS